MTPTLPVNDADLASKAHKKSRKRFNYKDKARVLLWMQQHVASFTETCAHFGIAESTLRKWSMRKMTIINTATSMKGPSKSIHKSTVPTLEALITGWIQARVVNNTEDSLSKFVIKKWLTQAKDQLLADKSTPLDAKERTALENLRITPHVIHKFMTRHHLLDSEGINDDDINSSHIDDLDNITDDSILPVGQFAPPSWDQRIARVEGEWGLTKPSGNRIQRIEHLERLVFGKTWEGKTMADRLLALE